MLIGFMPKEGYREPIELNSLTLLVFWRKTGSIYLVSSKESSLLVCCMAECVRDLVVSTLDLLSAEFML